MAIVVPDNVIVGCVIITVVASPVNYNIVIPWEYCCVLVKITQSHAQG